MTLNKMSLFLLIIIICQVVSARDNINSSGPAFMLGYGTLFGGGIGANFEYLIRKSNSEYTISPFIGAGGANSAGKWLAGTDVGCLFEYGFTHRGFIGFSYGMLDEMHEDRGVGTSSFHTERWMEVGQAIQAGYRGMALWGLCWIASINIEYIGKTLNSNRLGSAIPGFSAGVGYKL